MHTTMIARSRSKVKSKKQEIVKILTSPIGLPIWCKRQDGKGAYRHTSNDKTGMLRWDGVIDFETCMYWLDFDVNPLGSNATWGDFYDFCVHHFSGECHVMRSASQKVKLAFKFRRTGGTSLGNAVEEMKCIVGADIYRFSDVNGLTHSFIPCQEIDSLNDYIRNGETHIGIDHHEWRLAGGNREAYSDKHGTTASMRKVLHFIASKRGKSDVIYLPQHKVAETCGMARSSVNAGINACIKAGIITMACSDYIPGQLGKAYRITCPELRKLLSLDTLQGIVSAATKTMDLASFHDGNWFKALWYHTQFFDCGAYFMLFVQSIEGHNAAGKGRMAKARAAWKAHALRNGLN